jgi:ATP-binding cassette subfamily B protein
MLLMKDKNKKDKISLSTMVSNVFFVLGFTFREDKTMVLGHIIGMIIQRVTTAVVNVILVRTIINMLIDKAALSDILSFLLIAAVVHLLAGIAEVWLEYYFLEVRLVKAIGNIQRRFFDKSARIDLICYDDPDYYNDFVIAAQQADEMMKQAISCVSRILGEGLAILSVTAIIMTIHPIIAIFPVVGFVINILTRFAITRLEYRFDMEKKRINRKSGYSMRVFYQPEYAKEIKLTDVMEPLKNMFHDAIDEEMKIARQFGWKIAVLSLVNWILAFTTLQYFAVPVYLGFLALVRKAISVGDVVALKNATDEIQWWLDQTNYALIDFQKVGQYAEKFRRFIEYKEKIETPVTGYMPGEAGIAAAGSAVEIKNMSFSYKNDENYVLKNINMKINKGEKIAIVGENGAGKTTFVKLLMRLYDVSDGGIFYGDKDIREYNAADYRNEIGAVFQDYQLYAASLAENVKMDLCDIKQESQNIENALILADFENKLGKLDNGLSTELTREFSDDGTMFSGGESQKVAIARLFAKSSKLPLAILDEPSSALDPRAEYALNMAMAEKAKDSTIIFISHRLSTTRNADRIYMFENGGIIEQGKHTELMEMKGKYAEMFEKQSKYYKLNL